MFNIPYIKGQILDRGESERNRKEELSRLNRNATNNNDSTPPPRYEFNQLNCENLRDCAHEIADRHLQSLNNFDGFLNEFISAIDDTCKMDPSSGSAREEPFKPWITPGIIAASNKKHKLFKAWREAVKVVKKNHKNIKDPELELEQKHQLYVSYRRNLKYIISRGLCYRQPEPGTPPKVDP